MNNTLPNEDSCGKGYSDRDDDTSNSFYSTQNSADGSSSDRDSSGSSSEDYRVDQGSNGSRDNQSSKGSDKPPFVPRGPTNPSAVLDSSLKKKVMFNVLGQPIGENSIAYSTEVGSIARDMVPLTYDDWRSVDKGHKDIYWDTLMVSKRRFVLMVFFFQTIINMLAPSVCRKNLLWMTQLANLLPFNQLEGCGGHTNQG